MNTTPHKGTLVVVGTGIQWGSQLTYAARNAIEKADKVLFAAAEPWTAQGIRSIKPNAESFAYPAGKRRRDIYQAMIQRILEEVRKDQWVCAVFYGHPGVFAYAPHEVIRQARKEGYSAQMLPGVSFLDCLCADLGADPGQEGTQLYEATEFLVRPRAFDSSTPMILCQIGTIGHHEAFDPTQTGRIRHGLEVLAEVLCKKYPADHEVVIYEASAWPTEPPRIERVKLGDLPDAQVSAISTLYVPTASKAQKDEVMAERLKFKG
jgi:uncharacterized protein YabN with tetrapyrrole methylase and pyrophosphatase domain